MARSVVSLAEEARVELVAAPWADPGGVAEAVGVVLAELAESLTVLGELRGCESGCVSALRPRKGREGAGAGTEAVRGRVVFPSRTGREDRTSELS